MNLTDKEKIELRIKCVEPFIAAGSKVGLTNGEVFKQATELWDFATSILDKSTEIKKSK